MKKQKTNLFQRLSNIWRLSEYKPLEIKYIAKEGDKLAQLQRPFKQAQFIKKNPIDEITNGDKTFRI